MWDFPRITMNLQAHASWRPADSILMLWIFLLGAFRASAIFDFAFGVCEGFVLWDFPRITMNLQAHASWRPADSTLMLWIFYLVPFRASAILISVLGFARASSCGISLGLQ